MDQQTFRILGEVRKPRLLPDEQVRLCKNGHEAIVLCYQQRTVKYSQNEVAALCEIDKGHFSCILAGTKHMPENKRYRFMEVCNNLAPLQYDARQAGLLVRYQTAEEERIARLEQELAEAKAARAA